ncbi:hypothetical protein AB9E70_21990, partial [Escherichia coli]|uniref:hypothetical protein n=1 Tax=Escherichia coli TaxID=562 RepID=UPI0038B69A35
MNHPVARRGDHFAVKRNHLGGHQRVFPNRDQHNQQQKQQHETRASAHRGGQQPLQARRPRHQRPPGVAVQVRQLEQGVFGAF